MKLLNTIKEQLHTLKLTDTERADIRLQLKHHMHTYQPRNPIFTISPYMAGVWQKRLTVSMAAFLVVMLSGGSGLAYASFDSLPGDKLYTVKVTTEELQAAVKTTPEARANFEVKRAERRINEAVTLAVQGKLDEGKKTTITANLKRHTKQVAIETSKLSAESPEQAVEVNARLALSLEAGTKIIAGTQVQNASDTETLVAIATEVSAAQASAEDDKAAATEQLVQQVDTSITIDQLHEKKERIALAMKDWAPVIAETLPAPADSVSLETADAEPVAATVMIADTAAPVAPVMLMAKMAAPIETPEAQVARLITEADAFIEAGNYKDAFLSLQNAEDLAAKINLDLVVETVITEPVEVQPETVSEAVVEPTETPVANVEPVSEMTDTPSSVSRLLKLR